MAIERIGIIPAAGSANRYGGVMKELLPVEHGRALMDYAVNAMLQGQAEPIIVVTSARKIAAMAEHRPRLLYTIQVEQRDIWGAIHAGLQVEAEEYLFAMPDTVIPVDAFDRSLFADFMLGTFHTDNPERFGVLRDDHIVNKSEGGPGDAWGVLMWSRRLRDWWLQYEDIADYTHAFNLAMQVFGFKTFALESYTDISNFEDYRTLLCR